MQRREETKKERKVAIFPLYIKELEKTEALKHFFPAAICTSAFSYLEDHR